MFEIHYLKSDTAIQWNLLFFTSLFFSLLISYSLLPLLYLFNYFFSFICKRDWVFKTSFADCTFKFVFERSFALKFLLDCLSRILIQESITVARRIKIAFTSWSLYEMADTWALLRILSETGSRDFWWLTVIWSHIFQI